MLNEMKLGGNIVDKTNLSESFATYFDEKVRRILETSKLDERVYIGRKKIEVLNDNCMSIESVSKAIKSIGVKNSENFD